MKNPGYEPVLLYARCGLNHCPTPPVQKTYVRPCLLTYKEMHWQASQTNTSDLIQDNVLSGKRTKGKSLGKCLLRMEDVF